MCEYEIIFCKALHGKLREKVRGKIWVGVDDNDRLFVDITQREINTQVRIIAKKPFSDLIVNGYSVEDACNDAVIQYRRIILSHSFK
ncbi:hypothetical protein [uncultured Eubacterium sp.]|jgi:hypothetical protein|uniref:hypothetical protein n=1 Tax=uncultured Eubacterium sp. TaxID=165185 RepID=UPI0025E8B625|nr:hypothetical protein [uncultured Eubacterium sp.]